MRGRDAARGVAHQEPRDHRVDGQDACHEHERCGLAVRVGDPHGRERRDRGAAHADPEDPDRRPSPRRRVPGVDERDADRERRTAQAQEEATQDEHRVAVGDEADEQHRQDRRCADQREHDPGPEPVRERTDRDAAERAHDDRHRDEHRLLHGRQAERFAVRATERADESPCPEVHREADRREREHQGR
ncbi:hypothetical protein D3C74_325440 [compost metagenome]